MSLLAAWTRVAQKYEREMRHPTYLWCPDSQVYFWRRAMRARLHEKRALCLACYLTARARVPAVTRREIPMNEAPEGPQPVCAECAAEIDREDCK